METVEADGEYGRTSIRTTQASELYTEETNHAQSVWMSHGDKVAELPEGFQPVATSEKVHICAFCMVTPFANHWRQCAAWLAEGCAAPEQLRRTGLPACLLHDNRCTSVCTWRSFSFAAHSWMSLHMQLCSRGPHHCRAFLAAVTQYL